MRAWMPSASSAAEPIRRPTRMRYCATTSLPTAPITAATITIAKMRDLLRVDEAVDGLVTGEGG